MSRDTAPTWRANDEFAGSGADLSLRAFPTAITSRMLSSSALRATQRDSVDVTARFHRQQKSRIVFLNQNHICVNFLVKSGSIEARSRGPAGPDFISPSCPTLPDPNLPPSPPAPPAHCGLQWRDRCSRDIYSEITAWPRYGFASTL